VLRLDDLGDGLEAVVVRVVRRAAPRLRADGLLELFFILVVGRVEERVGAAEVPGGLELLELRRRGEGEAPRRREPEPIRRVREERRLRPRGLVGRLSDFAC
jgi:hypothetical protein